MKIGIGISLVASTPPDEGGGGELPEAPEGFAYLLNGAGEYIVTGSGDYVVVKDPA